MSKKILGDITAGSGKIYSKHLTVNLCYVNTEGLREEASIISSKVFKDCSYIIEYEPREVDLAQDYFIEVTYADLRLKSMEFSLDTSGESVIDMPNFNGNQLAELTVDLDLSVLNFTIEITGSVQTPRGAVCLGIPVQCNKVSLSSNTMNCEILRKAVTNNNGQYVMVIEQPFAPLIERIKSDDISGFKTDLDIQIAVLDDTSQLPIMYSNIFYDVKNKIEHDFVLGDENYLGLSNVDKQKAVFDSIPSFNDRQRDAAIPVEQIDYISNKMGISTDETTHFVNARNMGIKFNCDEDILFALLNGNANADYTSILFKTDAELLEKVNNAIDNNIIYIPKNDLEEQIADLKEAMITEYIQNDENFLSKYETIGVERNEIKENIVAGIIEWTNDPILQHSGVALNDYLFEQEILTEKQYNKAVLYDGITTVSEWNTELAKEIIETYDRWTQIDNVIADENKILQIIKQNNNIRPESFSTAEEYVEHIDKMLEKEYPSQYLKNEICREENSTFLKDTKIETFLSNNPDFQFGKNHALVTLSKEGINLDNIEKVEDTTEVERLKVDLQKVEQLYQLTPVENKSKIMEALWDLELTSAHSIASYSQSAFNELVNEKLTESKFISSERRAVSSENINSIYNLSASITTKTTLIMYENGLLAPPVPTTVVPGYNYSGGTQDNNGLPTIKDLFGSQDYFQYPESRTLLSPAAYLMDLLQFLKGTTNPEGQNLNALFARRPDIKHILLGCSNTDNIMPHIDLVNEIFEIAVAKTANIAFNEQKAFENLQTNWETKDLIAFPENTSLENTSLLYIAKVYDELKKTEAPWSLPFYFYLEEYRSYLKQLSLSREELIKYFTKKITNEASKTKMGLYEFLGLTSKDVEIITTQKSGNDLETALKKYYNKEIPEGNVHKFMSLTGLSYDEIKELLTSYYINPGNGKKRYTLYTIPGKVVNSTILFNLGITQVEIDKLTPGTLEATFIMKTEENASIPSPDVTFYDRLHRFERLRKKMNLKVHELDMIINYLNIDLSAENDILEIARILKIKEELNLKLEEILLLTGDFKFDEYPDYVNLYDYLFLRKTENYSLKEDFEDLKIKTTGFKPEFKYNEIPTILPYISGIKISEDTYNKIVSGEDITEIEIPTIDGLSRIFRIAYLCKSLNITEEEYYFLKQISGTITLTNPETLLQFISSIHQVKSYGFSIANLAYILNDKKLDKQTLALDDKIVTNHLIDLRKELRALKMEKDNFYINHILSNLQKDIEPIVDEAMKYIFHDFDTQNTDAPDLETVQTFISKHPDLFFRFQEEELGENGKTLQEFFLRHGTEPQKKLRAVLVGLNLENELTVPDFSQTDSNGKYYSEQDIKDIFIRIKSHILIEILNGTCNFEIILKDNFLDPGLAMEYNPETVVKKTNTSNNSSSEERTSQTNNNNNNDKEPRSKYTAHTDGNQINLNIDVVEFITNNAALFPANTDFLWPILDNNNYIFDTAARYKTFVFEKNMAIYDEKVAELRRKLSKFLGENDLDIALNIILYPAKAFANGDENNKIRDFISEKFEKFMPKTEAISKLYKIENSENNTKNGGFLVENVKSQYLKNYCDRVDLVLKHLTHDLLIDAIVRKMMNLCNLNDERYILKFLFDYFSYDTTNSTSFTTDNVAAIFGFLSNDFIGEINTTNNNDGEFGMSTADHVIPIPFILLSKEMYKLAQFVNTFKISHEMLNYIFKILYDKQIGNQNFDIINIFNRAVKLAPTNTNYLKRYLNFATAIGLSHTYFTEEYNFFEFFCKNKLTNSLSKNAKQYISEITNCAETDLNTLISEVLPSNELYINWFQHLLACQRIISFLGVTASTILDLHTIDDNAIDDKCTEKLRQIVKSKYSESEWDKISAALRDPLRIKQRDALRDYLISKNSKFKSSNDLFKHYLIDPEMIPMAKTSRLIQATLSVQLFIQRILMGMEEGLSLKDTTKEELTWRRNYRVWEANRKILFFPENWLDPELRHNKTEIFKSIEEQLLQNDIDDNAVLQAYYDYVEKLEEVSNLEILAAYRPQSANVTSNNFIAFVGRTQGSPHKYFYRKLNLDGGWTPWEEITNGIKTDMVKLVYWKGSMYMFWSEVYITSEIPKEHRKEYKVIPDENGNEKVNETYFNDKGEYTAIRMAWSRYKNGKWTKAVFCDEVYVEPCNNGSITNIHMTSEIPNKDIDICIYFIRNAPDSNNITFCRRADFKFNGAKLYLKFLSEGGVHEKKLYTNYIMITDFGSQEVINNKAICKSNNGKHHFKIKYKGTNTADLPNNNLVLFNEKNTQFRYNVLYEFMCDYKESYLFDTGSVANYIKPLVLEDQYNGKRFLGIPYKENGENITIQDNVIKKLKYQFLNLYYPYIEDIKTKIQQGYQQLFESKFHDIDDTDITGTKGSRRKMEIVFGNNNTFKSYYGADNVIFPFPNYEELSFGNIKYSGDENTATEDPYAIYNWEMFYHIPMLIADNLSRNMRFEEAQKWYHLIFDPTLTDKNVKGAKKYWKIKPFRDLFEQDGSLKGAKNIQEFINQVNADIGKRNEQIDKWKANPFNPHLVAQTRALSYMQYVVRKYLENIIAWADMYFTKDTREDINQAALLYILAAEILGVRPQKLEGTLSKDRPYDDLKNNADELSNVYETIGGILTVMADHFGDKGGIIQNVSSIQYKISYFGAPHNDKMEECWDTVADRLFKIRHCMNIQGVVRELPLTSPPIDPGLIAAAMAAGADLSTALSTLSAPLPLYRFSYMLQKAIDFTNDVKALGNSLLSVLEKCDAEELAILRSTHERAILNSMTAIREKAIEEAIKNIEALENSKVAVVARKDYYKNKKQISAKEQRALDLHKQADSLNISASCLNSIASIVGLVPQFEVSFPPAVSFGGIHLAAAFNALASIQSIIAQTKQSNARETDTIASYERRFEDWVFQGEQAAQELNQIDKQIAASQVRLAMAERELENHEKQMELKLEEFEFMKEKFTNKQLYNWMKGQVSKLYQQAYQMAHKLALAAEKAFKFEKQKEGYSSFITSAYWDNLKEGLMSGELLYNDLRRLEMEYIETNERDIELTKDISLAMIAPEALNQLRIKGACDFEIPEMLYDIDHPGHYLRRIKSVSVSIPAVTGPFSGVTCKLSMLNNRFRKSMTVGNDGYAYKGMSDTRFEHNIIGTQSIATSTGNNDSGMFEFNFNDERYLPFEGAGAIGRWQIDLPSEIRKFDYATIADVILHVKYTAKNAGGLLKEEANNNISKSLNYLMDEMKKSNGYLVVAHSLKSEFADAFHQLCEDKTCSLTIEKKHLPFMIVDYVTRNTGKSIIIEDVLFSPKSVDNNYTNKGMILTDDGIVIELTPSNGVTLSEQEDIYMVIQYKIE